jgi:hypothetical protein
MISFSVSLLAAKCLVRGDGEQCDGDFGDFIFPYHQKSAFHPYFCEAKRTKIFLGNLLTGIPKITASCLWRNVSAWRF